jgi:hypothetical protein
LSAALHATFCLVQRSQSLAATAPSNTLPASLRASTPQFCNGTLLPPAFSDPDWRDPIAPLWVVETAGQWLGVLPRWLAYAAAATAPGAEWVRVDVEGTELVVVLHCWPPA